MKASFLSEAFRQRRTICTRHRPDRIARDFFSSRGRWSRPFAARFDSFAVRFDSPAVPCVSCGFPSADS